MEDKRRRARVQGAWAGSAKSQAVAQPATTAKSHLRQSPGQTWTNKEHHLSDKQFVFKEPQQVVHTAPEPRVIDKEGVYEISQSPTGVSRVCLYPGFVDLREADWVLEQLCREVPWKQRTGIREAILNRDLKPTRPQGYVEISQSEKGDRGVTGGTQNMARERDVTYQQPRLTAWYGELPYTYSRVTMEPNPHWHPVLRTLKNQIEENTGHTFNSLLCNLYRNEKDSVDWHSDDEPSLGRCPVIASLSFGATRTFEMRKKPPPVMIGTEHILKGKTTLTSPHGVYQSKKADIEQANYKCITYFENGDYTYVERVKIPLDHGTLLIMEGATQADWQHRVPKEYHSRAQRINLTFRTVYPDTRGAHQ